MLSNLVKKYWPIPIFLTSILGLIFLEEWKFIVFPFLVTGLVFSFINFRNIFFLLYLAVPLSFDYSLPNGSQVDMFSEPLMIIFSCVFFLLTIGSRLKRLEDINTLPYQIVGIHLFYLLISTFYSVDPMVSFKYLLAKSWFLISLFFLPSILKLTIPDIKKIIILLILGLTFTIIYTSINHAKTGFTFQDISNCSEPFFINHVNYSTALAIAFPFILFLYKEAPEDSVERLFLWRGVIVFFIVAIILSYTRATWLSLLLLPLYGVLLRKKLILRSLKLVILSVLLAGGYLTFNDNYLKFAPDYETTVFNRDSFGDHMTATFAMKDVSGMERVYRWVAAVRMFGDRPLMGTGPNTFYPTYFQYTVSAFQTYVSDNPERSTVHNYFLLLLSEQGVIGLLLFGAFLYQVLMKAQRSYFTNLSKSKKNLLTMSLYSIFILLLHLLLNDLVEVDKIAAVFFLSCVIILKIEDIKEEA